MVRVDRCRVKRVLWVPVCVGQASRRVTRHAGKCELIASAVWYDRSIFSGRVRCGSWLWKDGRRNDVIERRLWAKKEVKRRDGRGDGVRPAVITFRFRRRLELNVGHRTTFLGSRDAHSNG